MFSMKNEENAQCPKVMKMLFSQSNCPYLKCFLGYLQSSGSSLAEKILPQFREFFLQFPEMIIKQITFSKNSSSSECFKCRRGMQFWKPRGNIFVKKSQIFRPMFENGQIFISPFLFENFFCKLKLLWRRNRRQFWQPLLNF